jgi:MATE family multidrug resistance protein
MLTSAMPSKSAESAALVRVATPLMVSYVADVLGMIISKAVIGRLGYFDLAAAGIALDLSFQIAIVIMGLFSAVGVLSAESLGARRPQDSVVALFQGLWLAVVFGVLAALTVYHLDVILHLTGQSAEIIGRAAPYYHAFSLALPALIISAVLRAFLAAMMRTGWVLAVSLFTVALQYPLIHMLVHGGAGLPAMGLWGAGLGMAIVVWLRLILLAVVVLFIARKKGLTWPAGSARRNVWDARPILSLGLPVAGIVALESGLFAATSQMSGWLGPVALAAYQMMMPWIAIPFVISLGLAEAGMVRVSYWGGAENARAARVSGNLAMIIGVGVPLLLIAVPLFAPQLITRVFLDPADPGYGDVMALVSSLLFIAAIFQVFDSLQAVASHVLRGLKDTTMPLVIAGIGYWAIGLCASYTLAFRLGYGAHGLWWGVALGLAFTGLVLAWRFESLAKRQIV